MNLQKHYNDIYDACIKKVKSHNFLVDNHIDSKSDKRYGLTLLIRPPVTVTTKIQTFLDELKEVEPNQYYYRNSDIHVTVMSIISCYQSFKLDQINVNEYSKLISKSLVNKKCFHLNFNGITATESGVMLQGFLSNSSLNDIRNSLRINFQNSDLEQSIDKRYSIQTAHSTVVRFRSEVKNKLKFLDLLEKYREYNFGGFKVETLELVGNDWYQKKEKVKKLSVFDLKENI